MSATSSHSCDDVCGKFQIHPRRKICKGCKFPRDCHPLTEQDVREIQDTVNRLSGEEPSSNEEYAWIPPRCPEDRLKEYFSCFSDQEVPKHNSEGFQRRLRLLRKQIPITDVSASACRFVEPSMTQKYEDFTNNLKKESLHFGYVKGKFWHTKCFECELCREVMTDFGASEGKFYCIKCFNEHVASRCDFCKEIIENVQEFVKFEDKEFHIDCFNCKECKRNLSTGTFLTHGGMTYCKECHTRMYGVRCFKCKDPITGEDAIMYKEQPYHDGCFTCHSCQARLGKQLFKTVEEDTYCTHCYGENFCSKCHSCRQPIVIDNNNASYSYGDFKWHQECFICEVCEKSLDDVQFAIQGSKLICKGCTSRENPSSTASSKEKEDPHRCSSSRSSESHHRCLNSGSSEDHRQAEGTSKNSDAAYQKKQRKSNNSYA